MLSSNIGLLFEEARVGMVMGSRLAGSDQKTILEISGLKLVKIDKLHFFRFLELQRKLRTPLPPRVIEMPIWKLVGWKKRKKFSSWRTHNQNIWAKLEFVSLWNEPDIGNTSNLGPFYNSTKRKTRHLFSYMSLIEL